MYPGIYIVQNSIVRGGGRCVAVWEWSVNEIYLHIIYFCLHVHNRTVLFTKDNLLFVLQEICIWKQGRWCARLGRGDLLVYPHLDLPHRQRHLRQMGRFRLIFFLKNILYVQIVWTKFLYYYIKWDIHYTVYYASIILVEDGCWGKNLKSRYREKQDKRGKGIIA